MDRTTLFRKKPIEEIRRDAELGYGVEHALEPEGPHLRRALGLWDLTSFGIAAIIGAGIFSTIGNAAFHGGPGVTLLFVFTAIACAFSALCYAEFASRVPVSGSAYTYAYASFGELIAWIIGWDLLIEYAIGNIAVAISWSDYFTGLLSSLRFGGLDGIHLPAWMTMDYLSAARGHAAIAEVLGPNATAAAVGANADLSRLSEAFAAWTGAPRLGSAPSSLSLAHNRAAWNAMLVARAVLPMPGRPAMMMRSDGCSPPSSESRSLNPDETPEI